MHTKSAGVVCSGETISISLHSWKKSFSSLIKTFNLLQLFADKQKSSAQPTMLTPLLQHGRSDYADVPSYVKKFLRGHEDVPVSGRLTSTRSGSTCWRPWGADLCRALLQRRRDAGLSEVACVLLRCGVGDFSQARE
jgi:hypothetical protein